MCVWKYTVQSNRQIDDINRQNLKNFFMIYSPKNFEYLILKYKYFEYFSQLWLLITIVAINDSCPMMYTQGIVANK